MDKDFVMWQLDKIHIEWSIIIDILDLWKSLLPPFGHLVMGIIRVIYSYRQSLLMKAMNGTCKDWVTVF